MAAKRISKTSVNWAALAERIPPAQKPSFFQFKTKVESYLRKVNAYPENPPKIDWAYYKANVPVAGMVDDFKKQYEALKIPYPPNTLSTQLDELEKKTKQEIAQFKSDSDKRIVEYQKQLDHLNSLLPYSEMTMEDFKDYHPEVAVDTINRPTFWPNYLTEEELEAEEKAKNEITQTN